MPDNPDVPADQWPPAKRWLDGQGRCQQKTLKCSDCGHVFDDNEAWGLADEDQCPICGSQEIAEVGEETEPDVPLVSTGLSSDDLETVEFPEQDA